MQKASTDFLGKPCLYMGIGGTIPIMGMLGEKFPDAQFLVPGLLGPKSDAHGPIEFLQIETGKRLTGCVAQALEDHFKRQSLPVIDSGNSGTSDWSLESGSVQLGVQ